MSELYLPLIFFGAAIFLFTIRFIVYNWNKKWGTTSADASTNADSAFNCMDCMYMTMSSCACVLVICGFITLIIECDQAPRCRINH